jgi:hypothetical protein
MRKCPCVFTMIVGLFIVTLGVTGAKADSATITGTGVWGSGAATSSWSAPGEAWSLSMTLLSPAPAINLNGTGEMLTTAISSFAFTLNGVAVNIAPSAVVFFPSSENGGFDIQFTAGGFDANGIACSSLSICSLNFFGSQLFSGDAPFITIQSGSVGTIDFDYTASGDGDTNPAGTGSVGTFTVTTVATPEPATLSLLALGVLGLLAKRRTK